VRTGVAKRAQGKSKKNYTIGGNGERNIPRLWKRVRGRYAGRKGPRKRRIKKGEKNINSKKRIR